MSEEREQELIDEGLGEYSCARQAWEMACARSDAAYARGKADGMAEAEARIIAWVRGEANEGYNEIQIADALERGEHRK